MTVVTRELLTGFFAAIGSHPHVVATGAAPVEMTLAMPTKRKENHTVLVPTMRAFLANANLVFRAGESPFGHRNAATIASSAGFTCTTNCEKRRRKFRCYRPPLFLWRPVKISASTASTRTTMVTHAGMVDGGRNLTVRARRAGGRSCFPRSSTGDHQAG